MKSVRCYTSDERLPGLGHKRHAAPILLSLPSGGRPAAMLQGQSCDEVHMANPRLPANSQYHLTAMQVTTVKAEPPALVKTLTEQHSYIFF